jgi:hypothetical protein
MSIDLSGWPESEGFQLRIAGAGLQAFANDREEFVSALVYPEAVLDDARGEGRDEAARISRAISKLAREWTSERITRFTYSCDLFGYTCFSNKKARVFLVVAEGDSGITTVCGGDSWRARFGERWRPFVAASVVNHILLEQPCLPTKISIESPSMITELDLAFAFSKSSAHAKDNASRFLESFCKAMK